MRKYADGQNYGREASRFPDNQNKASTAQNMPMPRNGDVLRIPVVFHVIYNTDKQNIPDEDIYNQMEVINDAIATDMAILRIQDRYSNIWRLMLR